jgi:predicted DCC family thiol-disulfide oxidoreductase YuxK
VGWVTLKLSVTQPTAPIILFDGVCNLCNAAVQWVIDHDPQQTFRFASLQSQAARAALPDIDSLPDSIILIDEDGVHTRSTAALRIARRLGFPWSLAAIATPLPNFLRDAIYKWIARNRYSWFGRQDTCRMPTPELAARFLDAEEVIPVSHPTATPVPPSTSFFTRLLYAYSILYIFPFPIPSLPAYTAFWHRTLSGLAETTLGYGFTVFPAGSGDTTYNYFETAFDLSVAVLLAVLTWRVPLPRWFPPGFRTYVRYFLGASLITYGWAKLIPMQFPYPSTSRLLNTLGDTSPMGLLWTFMGLSPAYQMLTGAAELLAGSLLLFRRTALLGSLLGTVVLTQVVALNYCYDVPVKLFSTHLLGAALLLLAPNASRLLAWFLLQVPAAPVAEQPFVISRPWWPNLRLAAKTLFILGALVVPGYSSFQAWASREKAIAASPLHGMYDVIPSRSWRSVAIQGTSQFSVRMANGAIEHYLLKFDSASNSLQLSTRNGMSTDQLQLSRPASGNLHLSGRLAGEAVEVDLRRVPPSSITLTGRGFHWINEFPFNK